MLNQRHWIVTVMIAAGLVLALVASSAVAAGKPAEKAAPTVEKSADEDQQEEAVTMNLDGAKVYAWNCGFCHSERYPKERSDAKWKIIVMHMRVRANLTAEQADAVLIYLKGNN